MRKPSSGVAVLLLAIAAVLGSRLAPLSESGLTLDGTEYGARVDPNGTLSMRLSKDGDAFHFRTLAVERGEAASVPSSLPALASSGRGVERSWSAGVRETFTARDDGVEQAWAFATKPAGTGSLTVTVQPPDGRHTVSDEGHVFAHGSSTARYGHATWIDGEGFRTAIPVEHERGLLVMRVPHDVLERSRYPAVLDPLVSVKLSLAYFQSSAAQSDQMTPAITYGSGSYVVVWADQRSDPPGIYNLHSAVVSSTGGIVQTVSTALTGLQTDVVLPAITSNQTQHLVTYVQTNLAQVWSVRLNASASLSPPYRPVSLGTGQQQLSGAVAPGLDGGFVVAWAATSGTTHQIRAARINAAADVLEPGTASLVVATASVPLRNPAIALAPGAQQYLVAWEEYAVGGADLKAARVAVSTASLTTLDTTPKAISTAVGEQLGIAVAFDGTNYVLAWEDQSSGIGDIQAARVSVNGTLLDPVNGVRVVTAIGDQRSPSVASLGGGSSLLAWMDERNADQAVHATTWTNGVLAPDESVANLPGEEHTPRVAAGADGYYLVFASGTAPERDIFGVLLTREGKALSSPTLVSRGKNFQREPTVSTGSAGSLVAWSDGRAGADLYASRISFNGEIRDPVGLPVAVTARKEGTPASAPLADRHILVWSEAEGTTSAVRARFVEASGTLSSVISLGNGISSTAPCVASNGSTLLLAWSEGVGTAARIRFTTMSGSGAPLLAAGVVADAAGSAQRDCQIAWNGTEFLLAWTDARNGNDDVLGLRITTGAAKNGGTLSLAAGAGAQTQPSLAWNGARFLLAYLEGARTATRELVDFAPQPASLMGIATNTQTSPAAAYDGKGWVVSWLDRSVSALYVNADGQESATSLDAWELRPEGLVLSSPGDGGPVLFAYARYVREGAYADRLSLGYVSRPGTPCSAASPCATGFCDNGICCNVRCGTGDTSDCVACAVGAGGGAIDGICAPIEDGTFCGGGLLCWAGQCAKGPDGGTADGGGGQTDAGMDGVDAGMDLPDAGADPHLKLGIALDVETATAPILPGTLLRARVKVENVSEVVGSALTVRLVPQDALDSDFGNVPVPDLPSQTSHALELEGRLVRSGVHPLEAQVVDANGRLIAASTSVTVEVGELSLGSGCDCSQAGSALSSAILLSVLGLRAGRRRR